MLLSKNILQNLFLIILAISISLNASINPIVIQIGSIGFIFIFILCFKNNEIIKKIKINFINNKVLFNFFFYILFI